MTSRERVLKREYDRGRMAAMEVQERSPDMNGTELYAVDDRIPQFKEAVKKQNMLTRKAGFVCKSSAGRVVRLLQPYNSSVYTAEPEELPAQYGFVWSDDPAKALPFVAISTSPYMKGNCCTENGAVYRSKIDNNVHAPSAWPQGWELVNN
jgi:hypothetical protein